MAAQRRPSDESLIQAGVFELISWMRGRAAEIASITKSVAKQFKRFGEITQQQVQRLVNIYDTAAAAGHTIEEEGTFDPEQLPQRSDLPAAFRYTVVFEIHMPDGLHDTYPVDVLSEVPLNREEIEAAAVSTFDTELDRKYPRLAMWDVNRRLGNIGTELVNITEAWRQT